MFKYYRFFQNLSQAPSADMNNVTVISYLFNDNFFVVGVHEMWTMTIISVRCRYTETHRQYSACLQRLTEILRVSLTYLCIRPTCNIHETHKTRNDEVCKIIKNTNFTWLIFGKII